MRSHRRSPGKPPNRACRTIDCCGHGRLAAFARSLRTASSIRRCSGSCFPKRRLRALQSRSPRISREMRVSLWVGLLPACRENLRRQQTACGCLRSARISSRRARRAARDRTLAGHRHRRTLARAMGQCARGAGFLRREGGCGGRAGADGRCALAAFRGRYAGLPAARTHRTHLADRRAVGWLGELHPQLVKAVNSQQRGIFI